MKLILDTDPGIDDAMAYLYAHGSPDIDLIGCLLYTSPSPRDRG